ncbi:MucBP domain-containing protein [Lentilactobacillus sunkii]|uniref:MucBP domain-containing protein n=1 Tax=Lentilactobacillus sunkii TaxID=481719 RepID=UPI000710C91B|nr:MucBP domain-containing protein [Lentilactobacillus sunkii]
MKKAILLSVSLGILGASSPLINEQVAKADTSTANVSKGSVSKADKNANKQVKVIEKYYVKSLGGTQKQIDEVETMLDLDANGNVAVPNHPGYTTAKSVMTLSPKYSSITVRYDALPAQVTINYKDESGKILNKSVTLTNGTLNAKYDIRGSNSDVGGYDLINRDLLKGKVTSEKMNIDLVFRPKKQETASIDIKNTPIKSEIEHSTKDKQVNVKNDSNAKQSEKKKPDSEKQATKKDDSQSSTNIIQTGLTEPEKSDNITPLPQKLNEGLITNNDKGDVTQSTSRAKTDKSSTTEGPNGMKSETKLDPTTSSKETTQSQDTRSTANVQEFVKLTMLENGSSSNKNTGAIQDQTSVQEKPIITASKATEKVVESEPAAPHLNIKDQTRKKMPVKIETINEVGPVKEASASTIVAKKSQNTNTISSKTAEGSIPNQSSDKEKVKAIPAYPTEDAIQSESRNQQVKPEEPSDIKKTVSVVKSPEQPKEKPVVTEIINKEPVIKENSAPSTPKTESANKDVDDTPSKPIEKETSKVVKVPQVDKKAVTSKNQTNEVLKGMPAKGHDSGETKDESTTLSKKSTERFESYHLQGIDAHGKSLFNKTLQLTPSEAIKFQSENVEFYGYDLVSTKLDNNSKTFTLSYKPKRVTFKIVNVDEDGKILSSDSVQLDFGEEQTYTPKLVPGYQAKQASQTLKADNLLPEDIEFNYTKLPDKKAELTKDSRQKGDRLNKEEHHSLTDKEANSHKSANNNEESDEKLPQTGDHNSYLSILTGLSLLIVLIGKKILKRYI